MADSDSLGNSRELGKTPSCSSVASRSKFESFFIYLHLPRVKRYLYRMVNIFFGLFRRLAILSPFGERILSLIASI